VRKRRDKIRMRLCRRRAAVRKLCHFRPTLLLDKITLEVEPAGGGAHADDEHVRVAELPGRAALIAALISDLLDGSTG